MAILTSTANGYFDSYGGQRYYEEQERRYREEMLRRQYMGMQQQMYNPSTDTYGGVTAEQIQQSKKPAPMPTLEPDYISNKKLLLLEK